jgi:hypothetical protein
MTPATHSVFGRSSDGLQAARGIVGALVFAAYVWAGIVILIEWCL